MEGQFWGVANRGLRTTLYWIVVILVVVVDQCTKAAAREIVDGAPRVLIPGVINIVHVENTGAAFSMAQGATALFILIALAFVIGATLYVWREPDLPVSLTLSIGLVAGGGLGNMIDRILDGAVTDFISTVFIDFPVFNIADICVTVGVALCIVGFWMWDSQQGEEGAVSVDGQGNV